MAARPAARLHLQWLSAAGACAVGSAARRRERAVAAATGRRRAIASATGRRRAITLTARRRGAYAATARRRRAITLAARRGHAIGAFATCRRSACAATAEGLVAGELIGDGRGRIVLGVRSRVAAGVSTADGCCKECNPGDRAAKNPCSLRIHDCLSFLCGGARAPLSMI